MESWTLAVEGNAFEFNPILKSLEPFRKQLVALSGLNSIPPETMAGQNGGMDARASAPFLTDVPPKSPQGEEIEAGTSMDRIAAKKFA